MNVVVTIEIYSLLLNVISSKWLIVIKTDFFFCSKSVVEIEVAVGEDLEQRHQK